MKIRFGIAVAGLSGSAGDTVAATWKGIAYFRTRVIPHNPKSAAQILQRDAFKRCVDCFQHLGDPIKAHLDVLGSDVAKSGFNIMMSASVLAEKTDQRHPIIPANKYLRNIEGYALAEGTLEGEVDLSWTTTDWQATDTPYCLVRTSEDAGATFPTPWQVGEIKAAVDMTAGALILENLGSAKTIAVCLVAYNAADEYCGGVHAEQAAKGA